MMAHDGRITQRGQVRVLRFVRPGDYDKDADQLHAKLSDLLVSDIDADNVMTILDEEGLLDAPSKPGVYVEVRLDDPDAAVSAGPVTITWGQS